MSSALAHPFRGAGWIMGCIAASLGAGLLAPVAPRAPYWPMLAPILAGLALLPALLSLLELSSRNPAKKTPSTAPSSYLGLAGGLATWGALVQLAAWNLQAAGQVLGQLPLLQSIPPPYVSLCAGAGIAAWHLTRRPRLNATSFLAAFFTPVLLLGILRALDTPLSFSTTTAVDPQHWPALWVPAFAGIACLAARARRSDSMSAPTVLTAWGIILTLSILSASLPYLGLGALRIPLVWSAVFGAPWGSAAIITTGIILLIASSACLRSASFQTAALGNERLLPGELASSPRPGIPRRSTLLALAAIFASQALVGELTPARLSAAFLLLTAALLNLTVLVVRESQPQASSRYKIPFFPALPAIGALLATSLLVTLGLSGWIAASLPLLGALAIFHTFVRAQLSRMAWLHDEGLDWELREILKEKGLHPTDPYDDIILQATVLERDNQPLSQICLLAAEHMASTVGMDSEEARDQFLRSINSGFLPADRGVALPHLRSALLREPCLLLLRSQDGIAPDGQDSPRWRAFFFLATPKDNPAVHLHTLARIAARLQRPHFMEDWLSAQDASELKELLLRHERSLSLLINEKRSSARLIGKSLRELKLPEGCLVALLRRNDTLLIPRGSTTVCNADRLTFIGEPDAIRQVHRQYVLGLDSAIYPSH